MFRLKSSLIAARHEENLCGLDIPEGHWQFITTSPESTGIELPYYRVTPHTRNQNRSDRQTYGCDGQVSWIVLDTCSHDGSGGSFCDDRRHWLSKALTQSHSPIILFMAYPPFSIDLNEYYIQGFDDEGVFSTLLMRSRDRIRGLIWHYGDRPVSGVWQGIPHYNLPYLVKRSISVNGLPPKDNGIKLTAIS
ncbi:hypothetical protein BFW38_07530 [Terasakiispira papahanaumokuakeensis]|uniref:Uncharacterized protein n=1 Tax=Terasakiispira papahanaumokuakeensis TaxID=197479 RepID=A0A1E2V8V5_9GAMM|nr:hypothetical protein [Terasakiispira papahanaumokuakeensis]ODC03421.1 hypothetical protein BFW38_07530 [Terasakiispira papahanaumokuakeensis]